MTLVGCQNMKLLLMMIDSNGDVQIGIDVGDRRFSTHLAGKKKKKKQEQEEREKEDQASLSRHRQRRRFFLPEKMAKRTRRIYQVLLLLILILLELERKIYCL